MTCNEIIAQLESLGSPKYKANVVKMGIPEQNSIGVSTGEIRTLAKKLGKSNEIADELWNTGYHEAKLLAVLIYDKKTVSLEKIEQLMQGVFSWDLCDHLCKNLILKIKGYENLIGKWCNHEKTYYKRAAFTLIASTIVHNKSVESEEVSSYLYMIKSYSDDEREHVKKAVSWALREIGKKDYEWQERAIIISYELKETSSKPQKWIANDALKELENLVQVEGRGRLISKDSKMGKEVN